MPKVNTLKNNFSVGELSPSLMGATETTVFQHAAETLENYFCLLGGGIKSRHGTKFVAETKDSTKASRLIPFVVAGASSYQLEFGHNYIRVFKDRSPVMDGLSPYEISTTYASTEVFDIDYCQDGNTLYIVHPSHPPAQLVFTSDTVWQLTDILLSGPAEEKGFSSEVDITLSSAAVGTGITATAASEVFLAGDNGRVLEYGGGRAYVVGYTSTTVITINIEKAFPSTSITGTWTLKGTCRASIIPSDDGTVGELLTVSAGAACFRASDVGNYIRGNEGAIQISEFVSATSVKGICKRDFANANAINKGKWVLESPSFGANNYPSAVTMYQQRLIFGGTAQQPQKIWGSALSVDGNRGNFLLGALDSDAYSFTVNAAKGAGIQFLSSNKTIVAHTYLSEFTIAGSAELALSPTNVNIEMRSQFGSAGVKPVDVGGQTVFTQRSGLKMRIFQYDFASDAYDAPDLTEFSEHVTGGGVVQFDYAQEPYSLIYAVTSDGTLPVMAINQKRGLQGWSRFTTSGLYESVSVIPTSTHDEVWCIVNRDGNRYVECFVPDTNTDCHVVATDSAKTVWDGLDHLEGMTVDIVADGSPQPQQVVTGGEITLSRAATTVEIGLPYICTVKDLPVEIAGGSAGQTSQGSSISCSAVTIRFSETKTAEINGNDVTFRRFGTSVLDQPLEPFSGDKRIVITQGMGEKGQITIRRTAPLNQTILGVFKQVTIND